MESKSYYAYVIRSLCSPMMFEIEDKSDTKIPPKNKHELVRYLLSGAKIQPEFETLMNGITFTSRYVCSVKVEYSENIRHYTLYGDERELNRKGFGLSYNDILSFDKSDPEIVKRFCLGVLSDILGNSQEEIDGLLYERSMLSSLIIGPELIRAQPSLAVSVMALILAFLCPDRFDEILSNLMWFTQYQGGNHFRFIGAKCVNDIFDLLVVILSNGDETREEEISKLIMDMIMVAYEAKNISTIEGFQDILNYFNNTISSDLASKYCSEILRISSQKFIEVLNQ